MKKMLAMLLAVLTLCFGAAAMAESVPEVDDAAEQAALTRPDRQRPADRGRRLPVLYSRRLGGCELTDEETEAGYVFAAASADEANQLIITYQALDCGQDRRRGAAGSCRSVSDRDRDGSQRHFRRRVPRCG